MEGLCGGGSLAAGTDGCPEIMLDQPAAHHCHAALHLQLAGCVGDALDIQQACVEEAALLQGPVSALRVRLAQLLLEWPEHPVLLLLHAICDRLTGGSTPADVNA